MHTSPLVIEQPHRPICTEYNPKYTHRGQMARSVLSRFESIRVEQLTIDSQRPIWYMFRLIHGYKRDLALMLLRAKWDVRNERDIEELSLARRPRLDGRSLCIPYMDLPAFSEVR